MNYKNAYEELKRLYERLEQEKYKLILDSNGLINANGILQQENARLKEKIDKAINLLEDNQFIWSAMDDELLEILKEN